MEVKLRIRGVEFHYPARPVLRGISLEVRGGEALGLVGPNGAGKTTLLRCINRVLRPRRGTILVGKDEVGKLSPRVLARKVGYVPQASPHGFPATVFEVVLLGRRPYVSWAVSPRDREVVAEVLTLLGLEKFCNRDFNELSGGERQKVLIARALAQEPEVLLLDEPTSNLDLRHQLEVLGLVRSIVKEKGMAAVMAIHDLNLAARFSDKLAFLHRGRIHDVGEPAEVLTQENIRSVYGVEALISEDSGIPYIIPLAPIGAHPSPLPSGPSQGGGVECRCD